MAFSNRFSSGNPLARELRSFGDTNRKNRRFKELKAFIDANKQHRVAVFSGINVFPDRIIRVPHVMAGMAGIETEPDEQPIAGVSARVEAQEAAPRATLTRSLLLGGWQKPGSNDTRLTITGPGFTWSVPVASRDASAARTFAAELTDFAGGQRQF